MTHRVLTAFFRASSEADGALRRLAEIGVPSEDVSVLAKCETPRGVSLRSGTKCLEGAALGAAAGALVGAASMLLSTGGSLVTPALGLVVAGGWVASLAGAGAGGGLGAAIGAALGASIPVFEATYLDDVALTGGTLIAVRCPEEHVVRIQRIVAASGGARIRHRRDRSLA